MDAEIVMQPYAMETIKDPKGLPDLIRGWQIHVCGKDNTHLTIQGRLDELHTLIDGMKEMLNKIDAKEAPQ